MNILIFNWRDIKNPKAGGSELYFHEMAKRWVEKGERVYWIAAGWKNCKKKETINGIKVIRIGSELSLYALAPLEYLKIRIRPDIIIDVENGLPFFSPLFSSAKKILHIHHIHKDVWKLEAENKGIKEKIICIIGKFLEMKIMPLVYKNTKVISISDSSAKEIRKEGIGEKIAGIINPAFSRNIKPKIKRTKFPSLLFVNRIKKYKGVDTLIKAFLELEKYEKGAELYIAGGGDFLENARKIAKSKNIKFLGYIGEGEKHKMMEKCWIFVNPSYKEGWGIVNIEASYFGLPVVGSDVSGIKDSVINEKTGLLFEYGNYKALAEKIRILIENKRLREKLGKEGKKFAMSFSWDRAAEEYLRILKKV